MLTFLAAVFILLITPGPGVLSTAGVGAGFGFSPGLRYVAGLWLGTNLVVLAVITGMVALALSMPVMRVVLLVASAAYLLYMAARIAFSGRRVAFIHAERPPGFAGGLLLQIVNPKAYVVVTTLFSGFAFLHDDLLVETVLKFVMINGVWIPVHLLWLGAGVGLHRLDLSPKAHSIVNATMAMAMLAVVVLAVLAPR
ncbi:LysE family translocator [Polymorphum gilvum]|uniref:LysE family transport protein, putative n=1 Tax=Polymorphum gilvum (strain LMG 25793 / CGMCC 1.9160 / SL003B-26A1) TaxID=991905 RepID=F2J4D1_POLGS|nr:LysE family translocator [Polymorphum gilvum]ADZ71073.1 LysE family transport protein, putative [Polymorphum gilvum SL003B-26A1]